MSAPSNIERPGAGAPGDGSAEPGSLAGSTPSGTSPAAGDSADSGVVTPSGGVAAAVRPRGRASSAPSSAPSSAGQVPVPRGRRSLRGTLTAVLAVLAVLVVVAGLVLLVPRPNTVPLQIVDVGAAARAGGPELGFAPSVPSRLTGWTATIALVRHGTDGILTWHVGFITPQGNYVGLEQATRSNFTWENALDSGGMWVGTVDVDGHTWDHMEKLERNTTALILRRPGRVTLVTAKGGGVADAVTLIRSLPAGTLS